MKKKKQREIPPPYAAETKDTRFAGTFEVLIPIEGRVKHSRVPRQFPTMQAAEGWLHSPEGQDSIAEIIEDAHKNAGK